MDLLERGLFYANHLPFLSLHTLEDRNVEPALRQDRPRAACDQKTQRCWIRTEERAGRFEFVEQRRFPSCALGDEDVRLPESSG
jgi:hypothetical protein